MSLISSLLSAGLNSVEDLEARSMVELLSSFAITGSEDTVRHWNPLVDIIENDDSVNIYIHVPGVPKDSIEVDFYRNTIKVSGERIKPYSAVPIRKEITYGRFSRNIAIPISVTREEDVVITLTNGVLTFSISKCEERDRIRVPITEYVQ